MDDFLTIYRQYYMWPATGRRLVRGPRPPPDPASSRAAMETWEKAEGVCSAAWTGDHEAEVGSEWLRQAEELSRYPRRKDCEGACTSRERERIADAKLMALMIQRKQREDKKKVPIRRRPSETTIYRSDYIAPGMSQDEALWNFSDLIAVNRGVDQAEQVRVKDCGPPHCQRTRDTSVMPVYLQRGCLQRSTLRSHRKTVW
ncbi:uncharacterized protein LOC124158899 [Ischnura elegans]|uniref:uncharacterized protein LOC124158899 n=1 Tax=Ischnura elegans TaxID=197161 RepID=UPI001ED8B126|nr:uncharacterized protein LOC124158899 [Ischnura elegans]XP_046390266.1 uncharacterized protein LOC124158899 [Ischnura elegans]